MSHKTSHRIVLNVHLVQFSTDFLNFLVVLISSTCKYWNVTIKYKIIMISFNKLSYI